MGFFLASGIRRLVIASMIASALAFGYYAGNPVNLGFTVHAALSGAGSIHGRQTPPEITNPERTRIAHEAEHLFASPHKGPRADRYVALTFSRKGVAAKRQIAAIPVKADMMTTGSLPGQKRQKLASLTRETPASGQAAPAGARPEEEDGLRKMISRAERTNASLFLSSLFPSKPAHFPEFANMRSEGASSSGPLRISRGLKFKGESEVEYQGRQRRCLATALYFEARGEPVRGQLAVAQVVMNRVRSSLYPDTICGVVYQGQMRRTGCQFSFTCDGIADVPRDKAKWVKSNQLAKRVTDGETWLKDIGHATHYHANYVKPRWRREMNRIKQLGQHIFYRIKGEQIEDVLSNDKSPARGPALSGSG